jgi:WD40 repeat protein
MSSKYRVHHFDLKMTSDQNKLEQFLNGLEGEIIAIIPNVTLGFFREGRTVVSGPAGWQMSFLSGKCQVTGMDIGVHALAFSPDGRYLASGGCDNAIVLWGLPPGD